MSKLFSLYGELTATETFIALRSRLQAEEAQKRVKGLEENAVHTKYIELVSLDFVVTPIAFSYLISAVR